MHKGPENPEGKPLYTNDNNDGNTKSTPKIQPKYSIHRDVLTHEI
ncbi:hypothetical protein AWZ03_014997, partial [Drosophila navojoa]